MTPPYCLMTIEQELRKIGKKWITLDKVVCRKLTKKNSQNNETNATKIMKGLSVFLEEFPDDSMMVFLALSLYNKHASI